MPARNSTPVAVTGATGHVGAGVVRALLARGRRVRALVRGPSAALDGLDVECVRADVLDPESLRAALRSAGAVHHLAAVISIDGDRDGLVHRTNVEGTRNVARAALEAGVRRFVHYSSIHAFELANGARPVDELAGRPGPASFAYDRSKAAGEQEVREAVGRGLNAVLINPTGVIGPYDFRPSRTGRMLLLLARGSMPALVDGGFDWVDSRDVAEAALAAEERGRPGENYIVSGHWRSFAELARMVHACGGAPPPRWTTPAWLAGLAAPLAARGARLLGREPLLTQESVAAVRAGRVSGAKAARELGHRPRSIEATIRDTLAWHFANGAGAPRGA
jgi:dihydroflavonol-4-reductase